MNRKDTERIGEGFDVVVLGGEHGDEEQADRVVAHALEKVASCVHARVDRQKRRVDLRFTNGL